MLPSVPTAGRPEGPDLYCPGCGGRDSGETTLCGWCGYRLRRNSHYARHAATLIAGALLGCLALAGIVVLAVQAGFVVDFPRP